MFKKLLFLFTFFTITANYTLAQQFDLFYPTSPNLQVRANVGSVQLAIADCNGCYSSLAKPTDVVLRANGMATGNMIIAARTKDNIIFSTGDDNGDLKRMEIFNNGKVVIGTNVTTTPGDYRLYVEDGILAERLKVAIESSADWADYVFDPKYKLLPLEKVKHFIETNHHLPDIPAAEEMVKHGMDVAEINATLLRKIEELTLYMIETNEKMKEITAEMEQLKSQN